MIMSNAIETKANRCTIERSFFNFRERYYYDEKLPAGWEQHDTWQDAPYFGVWVNKELRQILTFAEGDETLVSAPDDDAFAAEYEEMVNFYSNN